MNKIFNFSFISGCSFLPFFHLFAITQKLDVKMKKKMISYYVFDTMIRFFSNGLVYGTFDHDSNIIKSPNI